MSILLYVILCFLFGIDNSHLALIVLEHFIVTQNHLVGFSLARQRVEFVAGEAAGVIEKQRQAPTLYVSETRIHVIDVIPTVLMEHVPQEGNAEQKLYLQLCHAEVKLVDHFLGDQIALVHVRAVGIDHRGNGFGRLKPIGKRIPLRLDLSTAR